MNQDLHALAAAFVLDALDAGEAAEFEAHLPGCDVCMLDVREMSETAAALALTASHAPPGGLRSVVLANARQLPQERSADEADVVDLTARRERRSAPRWLAGVAAAAVVVAGALGATTYQANQRADEAQIASEQIATVLADPNVIVERAAISGGGDGSFAMSPSSGDAVFLTAGLPDAGADRTYQLWAIDEAGATSVGLLEPDAGSAAQLVEMPDGAAAFGMSVEPAGGSPNPTTDPVLLVELPA
ncbi:MAG: anti-sigma factor [Actinomycetes bacterium]